MFEKRVEKVKEKMKEYGVGQLVITDPTSIYYLSGKFIHPGERFYALCLSLNKESVIYVNQLFSFEEDLGIKKVYFDDTDDVMTIFDREIDPNVKLGVDKTMNAKFLVPLLKKHPEMEVDVASLCVDEVRQVKTEEERELMRKASWINDQAMEQFKNLLRTGISEIEVADQMLEIYRSLGAEGYSFSPSVCFGSTSAESHHSPDHTRLKVGDTVLFDVGCRYKGYCSDMTRVFIYGAEPTDFQKEIYEIVRSATEAAEKMIAPGIEMASIDNLTRGIIKEKGYGENFRHRTGHFIGLEVHDYGDVSSANHNLSKPGFIFSIEPSICIDGMFKMYCEDLVLVTEDGCEVLNHYPHELQSVPAKELI